MSHYLKKTLSLLIGLTSVATLSVNAQFADNATFEIGDGTIPAYTTMTPADETPFFSITFDGVFANPPNVFAITPQFGNDPCVIRIQNVTTTGFEATCLEPLSEDRALSDGSGANVEFQSACEDISTLQYGVRCPECSGPRSFTPITFATEFNSMPAVLAQIQTTNNDNARASAPLTEPAFIDITIADDPNTSVTTTGFELSIDRLEAGESATLSESEEICYLATEVTANCQSLDFSSLGGPTTPVMFQALIGLQNVEGQNTAPGSTTNFVDNTDGSACFNATPVALANFITRNGGDGSIIRRTSVNTSGVTLIADEDTIGDTERNHGGDEQPAIFAFSEIFTTPVTLSSAQVSRIGRKAIFNWETSAETFHLGFNLWGTRSLTAQHYD